LIPYRLKDLFAKTGSGQARDEHIDQETLRTAALSAGGRAALTLACQTSAAGVLSTAPSSVVIDGLQYHPRANTEYFLQPYSRHGRPQFTSSDSEHHLYWSSVSPTGSTAVWQINGTCSVQSIYMPYL